MSVRAVPGAGVHCGALEEGGVVEVTWKRAPALSTAPVAKIHDHQCDRQDLQTACRPSAPLGQIEVIA